MNKGLKIGPGQPYPYGISETNEGVNFAVFSSIARSAALCLYSAKQPYSLIAEIPLSHKTGNVWHVCVELPETEVLYAVRINESSLLLDPFAKGVVTSREWGKKAPYQPLGLATTPSFSWENDKYPQIPLEELIIYEMHVRGFTQHASSQAKYPGTFLGVIEKIPHLLDLGINAVELLPIHEFDENETARVPALAERHLKNYWGYSTVNFFSPMQRYAVHDTPDAALTEFKMMVRALHQNGIEVILDVVYNHTAEGDLRGPILSFKGLDNPIYYLLDAKGNYYNFSGCGNTFNTNHPVPMELILQSLRYWVTEMHVDGFRFDLASIFSRGTDGRPHNSTPILEAISKDPILANTKLIAEPWDAAGLYEVSTFCTKTRGRWSEWNGYYRDQTRQFLKGNGNKSLFATRLCGSQDLYAAFEPTCSINFITAHDGFTLADLVSYNRKHNENNGDENRDGNNDNDSWNCGVEGKTTEPNILQLRERQMRNLHLALMLSRGVPMLLMGDEYGHTKNGNNNTWCQDELNWFRWDEWQENQAFYRFYKGLIHFRKQHPILRKNEFTTDKDIVWQHPEWRKENHLLAFTLKDHEKHHDLFVAFNASNTTATLSLPEGKWNWVVNTGNLPPQDFIEGTQMCTDIQLKLIPHSSVLLNLIS